MDSTIENRLIQFVAQHDRNPSANEIHDILLTCGDGATTVRDCFVFLEDPDTKVRVAEAFLRRWIDVGVKVASIGE